MRSVMADKETQLSYVSMHMNFYLGCTQICGQCFISQIKLLETNALRNTFERTYLNPVHSKS
jgi:DNA repair photolyase